MAVTQYQTPCFWDGKQKVSFLWLGLMPLKVWVWFIQVLKWATTFQEGRANSFENWCRTMVKLACYQNRQIFSPSMLVNWLRLISITQKQLCVFSFSKTLSQCHIWVYWYMLKANLLIVPVFYPGAKTQWAKQLCCLLLMTENPKDEISKLCLLSQNQNLINFYFLPALLHQLEGCLGISWQGIWKC